MLAVALSFGFGLVAGLLAAVPTGAAGVLVLETALRQGFWRAFWGSTGIAAVDATFAGVAVAFGERAVRAMAGYEIAIALVGGGVIAGVGLAGLLRSDPDEASVDPADEALIPELAPTPEERAAIQGVTTPRLILTFVLLTAVNPLNIGFFLAFIVYFEQLAPGTFAVAGAGPAFVVGVGLACLGWESVLARIGASGGRRASLALKRKLSFWGHLVVVLLGAGCLLFAGGKLMGGA